MVFRWKKNNIDWVRKTITSYIAWKVTNKKWEWDLRIAKWDLEKKWAGKWDWYTSSGTTINSWLSLWLFILCSQHSTDESQKGRNSCLRLQLLAFSEIRFILVYWQVNFPAVHHPFIFYSGLNNSAVARIVQPHSQGLSLTERGPGNEVANGCREDIQYNIHVIEFLKCCYLYR